MAPPAKPHPWAWFTDKVLPPLFVALCLAIAGGMWATYKSVDKLAISVESLQRENDSIRGRIANLESSSLTKTEMLETLKRVEQQLEIMMLRAGIRPDRKIISE